MDAEYRLQQQNEVQQPQEVVQVPILPNVTNICNGTFYIFVTFNQNILVGQVFEIILSQFFEEYVYNRLN
jgi:hypothetical protein